MGPAQPNLFGCSEEYLFLLATTATESMLTEWQNNLKGMMHHSLTGYGKTNKCPHRLNKESANMTTMSSRTTKQNMGLNVNLA